MAILIFRVIFHPFAPFNEVMKIISTALSLILASSTLLFSADKDGKSDEKGWISLFDGKSLTGWVQKNGKATYEAKDGEIVGTTAKNSENSFLCTEKDYGDFELEFEVKVDAQLNSGIMIRSQTKGGTNEGRVNGPQVEIEASGKDGAKSGYIYGEAIGGWMTPKDELKSHKLFKDGEWNKFRVLASGKRIQTWINGTAVSDLTDEKVFKSHPSGFIGLQVHGVGARGPYHVAWRNLRLRELKAE